MQLPDNETVQEMMLIFFEKNADFRLPGPFFAYKTLKRPPAGCLLLKLKSAESFGNYY